MNNDLIQRYIYAVVRYLPLKSHVEVEKELESLISEMLEERCGDIAPTEKDVRIVLLELGSPEELAEKYGGDESRSLISVNSTREIFLDFFRQIRYIEWFISHDCGMCTFAFASPDESDRYC